MAVNLDPASPPAPAFRIVRDVVTTLGVLSLTLVPPLLCLALIGAWFLFGPDPADFLHRQLAGQRHHGMLLMTSCGVAAPVLAAIGAILLGPVRRVWTASNAPFRRARGAAYVAGGALLAGGALVVLFCGSFLMRVPHAMPPLLVALLVLPLVVAGLVGLGAAAGGLYFVHLAESTRAGDPHVDRQVARG
jgi:hypothetical protein